MATEPTLGERIMDAADDLGDSRSVSRRSNARERLRALAARADAAERGMLALSRALRASVARMSVGVIGPYDDDEVAVLFDAVKDADAEMTEALAAWRALGEVDDERA